MKLRITHLSEHSVHLSNRTVWPTLDHGDPSLEWKLRYGDGSTRAGEAAPELCAARYVAAYAALVRKPADEREAIVDALMRAEKRLRAQRKKDQR